MIKAKDKSKYQSERSSTMSKATKTEFFGLMMTFSYFLNQLINTDVSQNMKE